MAFHSFNALDGRALPIPPTPIPPGSCRDDPSPAPSLVVLYPSPSFNGSRYLAIRRTRARHAPHPVSCLLSCPCLVYWSLDRSFITVLLYWERDCFGMKELKTDGKNPWHPPSLCFLTMTMFVANCPLSHLPFHLPTHVPRYPSTTPTHLPKSPLSHFLCGRSVCV